jgi:predicted nuclease with TOPRIM domain
MSKIELIVNSLEQKVQKVLYELAELKNDNTTLKHELLEANADNTKLLHTLQKKESDYDTLKFANSILGSDESKRETKLKINTLIKEIDECISKLSD